jgi:hypothetical protein
LAALTVKHKFATFANNYYGIKEENANFLTKNSSENCNYCEINIFAIAILIHL